MAYNNTFKFAPAEWLPFKDGDAVKKGDVIGRSGNTGRLNTTATGPYAGTHLHFEIRKYNKSTGRYNTVDPKLYLPWWR